MNDGMSDGIQPDPLEVLHVASFVGNVGDNANHNGTRRKLRENLQTELRYEESEIRKYYRNYHKEDGLSFDDRFVAAANRKDFVMIGGGSFFDFWLEESATGTTIDISTDQIDEIDVPIVFHGLGCIPPTNVRERIVAKFRTFLDHVLEADHCLVSVRNDGSESNIREHLGDSFADRIHTIPDGGFFMRGGGFAHPEISDRGRTFCINVASDMRRRRFGGEHLSYDRFVSAFAAFADELLRRYEDGGVVFVPHIYKDLEAISDVLEEMDVMFRRNRVTTAPYLNGQGNEKYVFDVYGKSDVAIGMRFHANVCSIGKGTPSIGLATGHPKVRDLYSGLGLPDRAVSVSDGFHQELLSVVEETVERPKDVRRTYESLVAEQERELDRFHGKIGEKLINAGGT